MAVELHLKRPDKTQSWGFRLAGGSDFDVPLTVIKVAPGSLAENACVQVGDVVVRVNETAISPLTHTQAHDVIVNSGNDFTMAVRRGDLSSLPSRLLLYETDVENDINPKSDTLGIDQQSNDADLNITDEEIATIIGEHVHSSQKKDVQVVKESQRSETSKVDYKEQEQSVEASHKITIQQSEVAKIIISEESQQQDQDKKWSTFLQKPKNVRPKPKPKEAEGPKAPPYRVVIKKQPKREPGLRKGNIKEDTTNNSEPEVQSETKEDIDDYESESKDVDEGESNEPSEEVAEEEEEGIEEIVQEEDEEETIRRLQYEKKLSVNLEEQLAEVQKQLLALSQMPSAIQQTLDAVTRQLSELVAASHQDVSVETSIRIEEEESIEEQTESVEYREQALSILEEASCEEEETGQLTFEEVARTESEDEQALFEALERECERESQIMTEEEMEERRLEQERQEKREKASRRDSSSQPLTPLERPIILPGGRKWSAPNDVVSKLRKPSLTDERIAKTISSYSEVITGRTMGINFLKYQPPPKNLDYLQKSAVYRLIHDIEPPARGIVARDIKVLSEEDYYGQADLV